MADVDDDDVLQLEENGADESDDDEGLQLEDNTADNDDEADALRLEENAAEEESELALEDNGAEQVVQLEENIVPAVSVLELKRRGNRAFKAAEFREAQAAYSEALAGCAAGDNAERSTLLTNRAACAIKLCDWSAAINDCTAALSVSAVTPDSKTKALFRRATAFLESGDSAGARRDLEQLSASDAAVVKLRARVDAAGRSATMSQPTAGAAASAHRKRVSCISPTTPERHLFHEIALYRCFSAQTHPDLELIVVDTGATPSPFFTSPTFRDARVTYLYQEAHQTIGEKRNLAIQHATGDIICHFDDDDLYAPEYISRMVAAMAAEDAGALDPATRSQALPCARMDALQALTLCSFAVRARAV